jgi:hypothetical protein
MKEENKLSNAEIFFGVFVMVVIYSALFYSSFEFVKYFDDFVTFYMILAAAISSGYVMGCLIQDGANQEVREC